MATILRPKPTQASKVKVITGDGMDKARKMSVPDPKYEKIKPRHKFTTTHSREV